MASEGTKTVARRSRRRWTIAEKLAIVASAKTSGDPVSVVARRYGMNANHLFNWLQRDRDGTLDRRALYEADGGPLGFVSLGVVGKPSEPPAASRLDAMVEIELVGGAKVRTPVDVDPRALHGLLSAVKAAL
jgi:transposase-like protein